MMTLVRHTFTGSRPDWLHGILLILGFWAGASGLSLFVQGAVAACIAPGLDMRSTFLLVGGSLLFFLGARALVLGVRYWNTHIVHGAEAARSRFP